MFHFGVYLGPYEFIYLFLCFLIFFIFVVLEFLEYLLYVLVDHSPNVSMIFSFITCSISSFSVPLGFVRFLGIVYLCFGGVGSGYPFLYFPLNPVLIYF
jgi:hypothetical protein